MPGATKSAEVRRILDRYLVEVVEMYDLCPWARGARLGGELAVEIVFGSPSIDDWTVAAKRALAHESTRVAMVIAPELVIEPGALRTIRTRLSARLSGVGIADFHPEATLDLATPARLVPFLRRSPDPLLQIVPLGLLDSIRLGPLPDRMHQAQALGGHATVKRDVGEQIASENHAAITLHHAAMAATLDAIAADRVAAYARVGISASR